MDTNLPLLRFSFKLALALMFSATNAPSQTLTAPPNQIPPAGSIFSSVNSNTVTANAGGTITLTGGTVRLDAASGGQIAGLLATGDQAKITATNVNIVNNNNQGSSITFGVDAASAATVTLSGGTIVTSAVPGGRAYGINSAVGGTVDATGVAVTTNSANSHAAVASGGVINLTGGSITTNGQFSLGLQANGNAGAATITVSGTTINTFGNTSSGADAEGSNAATITLTSATINTSGASANGLIAIGIGNTILPTDTNITTNGPSAAGAIAFSGGQIRVQGGTIKSTQGSTVVANSASLITLSGGTVTLDAASGGQVAGLLATGDQAKIMATNVSIVNNNNQGSSITFGVNATSTPTGAATVTLSGGTIVTSALTGGRAYGINSAVGGTVNATGVTIQTSGQNSNAVVASGGTINLINGSVTTSDRSAIGLQANGNAGPAVITAQGTTIKTSGPIAFGATLDGANASTISLKDVTLTTTGPGASGLAILGNPPLNTTNQMTLDNTVVNASQDGIVWVAQSNVNIDLKNGTTINPGSGTLLNVFPVPGIGSPTLNLNADGNVTLNGNVLVRGNSIANINLLNNSVLTGAIHDATNVSFESGSTWNITDSSTVTGNVSVNQGTLAF